MMFEFGAYQISLATTVGISITFALSLNLITGLCGQISLGHAAFYGIGAYCAALLTKAGFPFFGALLLAGALAASVGVIVGLASLRVRHDFLAITTMGVGFLFVGIVRQQEFLGGEMGISAIPDPGYGKLGYLGVVAGIAFLVILFTSYLKRSWTGFTFDTIASDEDTSKLLGIDTARYKLMAFALGTGIAGVAGGLYAHNVKFIAADSFGFIESVTVLSMVVIGGIGSVPGVIVAAILLSMLPQWFQFVDDYKLLLYGGLLFLVMRFSPDGLAGMFRALGTRLRQDLASRRP